MPKQSARSVGANVLSKIAESGEDSVVLTQRQRYAVAKQAHSQYISPLGWCECEHSEREHADFRLEMDSWMVGGGGLFRVLQISGEEEKGREQRSTTAGRDRERSLHGQGCSGRGSENLEVERYPSEEIRKEERREPCATTMADIYSRNEGAVLDVDLVSNDVMSSKREDSRDFQVIQIPSQRFTFCEARKCSCLMFERRKRAYPSMLPTQANGRWSTTQPPITNFPKQCLRTDCPHRRPGKPHAPIDASCWDAHCVFKPDPGWYWITWDKDAIEARVNAVLIEDEERIDAFRQGLDVHTINVCRTFDYPLPRNLRDPHQSREDDGWRRLVNWSGKEDLRRRLLKVVLYGTFYGPDETAILGAKGVEELDITRDDLLAKTRAYLMAQTKLQATKEARWDQYIRVPEARNRWGRRLRCYPTYQEKVTWIKSLKAYHAGKGPMRPGDAQKVLWNFEHSSFVADLINLTIINIKQRWPECRLVLNKHDSLTVAFPEHINPWPEIREIDEVTVTWPNGLSMAFTSTWHRVESSGSVSNLR